MLVANTVLQTNLPCVYYPQKDIMFNYCLSTQGVDQVLSRAEYCLLGDKGRPADVGEGRVQSRLHHQGWRQKYAQTCSPRTSPLSSMLVQSVEKYFLCEAEFMSGSLFPNLNTGSFPLFSCSSRGQPQPN